jgi:flagellar hook-basal body complex protein FliE
VVGLTTGEVEDVHQVMIAMNEADLAFRMMLEVRNKLVEAYKEVARLQM